MRQRFFFMYSETKFHLDPTKDIDFPQETKFHLDPTKDIDFPHIYRPLL